MALRWSVLMGGFVQSILSLWHILQIILNIALWHLARKIGVPSVLFQLANSETLSIQSSTESPIGLSRSFNIKQPDVV